MRKKPGRKPYVYNLELTRQLDCVLCYHPPPNDPHHLRSRGAGGTDEIENLVPLCRKCHTAIHTTGIVEQAEKYPAFKRILIEKGWSFNGIKWIR